MKFKSKPDELTPEQGWGNQSRNTTFSKMVFDMRGSRQKFKETKNKMVADKDRHHVLTTDRIEEYERIALKDKLTDFYNQRSFAKKLAYELKRAKRYKRPLALLVVAVDDLEIIGRQFGQLAIDDTLRSVASIIREAVRDVDIPARCGREMLAVIFPETYSSRALVVGERIREKIKTTAITEDLRHLRVRASVGIVSFPTHARDEHDLMNKAIEFLAQAQQDGGDRVYNG